MPTELPKHPRPLNPGTGKGPEDPAGEAIEKQIEEEKDSDIPSPLPDLLPGSAPGVPTLR